MRLTSAVLVALMAVAACGDDDGTPTADAPPGGGPDGAPGGPDAAMGTRFITSAYTIAPGTEKYQCERLTVATDTYIQRITPVNGAGTHHETFNIDPNAGAPDGTSDCGALEPNWIPLFASGVGSPSIQMPPGVALKIPAGSQVVLNLHLFNTEDTAVTAEAGLDVVLMDVADVQDEAEVVLAGISPTPLAPSIPPGVQTLSGRCSISGTTNLVAVFPHMHQLGTHIKMETRIGGVTTTAYEGDYDFNDQQFFTFPSPIATSSGDRIDVTCTYNNTTGGNVQFGDSSTQEMCFAITWRYPKLGTSFGGLCVM